MFIEQPPWFYRALFPGVTWRIPAEKKCVYLTFDDGPIPEVTPLGFRYIGYVWDQGYLFYGRG